MTELILLKADYQMRAGQWPNREIYLAEFADRPDAVSKAFTKIAVSSQKSDSCLPDLGPRFEVLELIGSGGMGRVYRAHDIKLGRDVAVKMLKKVSDELDKRFEREIRLTASLMHPNIVSLYDFIEYRGTKFAVLELVNGVTLREHLKSSEFNSTDEALRVSLGVSQALVTAHEAGVIHRDVKPENVMIVADALVKVLDFGLARPQAANSKMQLTHTNANPGTPAYMSPEQAAGQELTAASDVFSLGVLTFEMLTGTNPLIGQNFGKTIKRVIEFQQPDWSVCQIPVAATVRQVVNSMLMAIPEKRPSAKALVATLKELLASGSSKSTQRIMATTVEDKPAETPTNLPLRTVNLVGRETELRELAAKLQTESMVTLVGPGGAGKTSLAYQAARENIEQFPDGIWVCELAPIGPNTDLIQILASTLERTEGNQLDWATIRSRLIDKQILILLDNCEHVIDNAAEFTELLLADLPQTTVLATSRQPLYVEQETIYKLGGLNVDRPDSDAVKLFIQRAAAKAHQEISADQTELVTEIVRQLEGLPLTIELAAPKLTTMTLRELSSALSDQMSTLQTRRRKTDRQATVGQAIGWSYDLLTSAEQSLLCELSVFANWFTRSAAESVSTSGATNSLLQQLVDQSMIVCQQLEGVSRFRLLEPIRQFCDARIASENQQEISERHADYFSKLMPQISLDAHSEKEIEACRELNLVWSDLRKAVAWGLEQNNPEIAIDSIACLGKVLMHHMRMEAYDWLRQAETKMPDAFLSRPKVLGIIAMGHWMSSEYDLAKQYADRSNSICENSQGVLVDGFCLNYTFGKFEMAIKRYQRFQELAKQEGDESEIRFSAAALDALTLAILDSQDPRIDDWLEKSRNAIHRYQWPTGFVWLYLMEAVVAVHRDEKSSAHVLFQNAISLAKKCGCLWLQAFSESMLSKTISKGGIEADRAFAEKILVLENAIESGVKVHYPIHARSLVLAMIECGLDELAARCVPATNKFLGVGGHNEQHPDFPIVVEALKERLGSDQFESLQKLGDTMTVDDIVLLSKRALAELEADE